MSFSIINKVKLFPAEIQCQIIDYLAFDDLESLLRIQTPFQDHVVDLLFQYIVLNDCEPNDESIQWKWHTVGMLVDLFQRYPKMTFSEILGDLTSIYELHLARPGILNRSTTVTIRCDCMEGEDAADLLKELCSHSYSINIEECSIESKSMVEAISPTLTGLGMFQERFKKGYDLSYELTELGTCSNLRQLELTEMPITSSQIRFLPRCLEKLTFELEVESFSSVHVLELPNCLIYLSMKLSQTSSSLKNVEINVECLSNLRILELKYFQIHSLSSWILPKGVVQLSVISCGIKDLSGLLNLCNLNKLVLQLNPKTEIDFTVLPSSIRRLWLYCESVPNEICQLSSYIQLNLVVTSLGSDRDFSKIKNLNSLYLNGTSWATSTNFTSLGDLKLPSQLKEISFNMFLGLQNIRDLQSGNCLSSLALNGKFGPMLVKSLLRGNVFPESLVDIRLFIELTSSDWVVDSRTYPKEYISFGAEGSQNLRFGNSLCLPNKLQRLAIVCDSLVAEGDLNLPSSIQEVHLKVFAYIQMSKLVIPEAVRRILLPEVLPKADFHLYHFPTSLTDIYVPDESYKVTLRNTNNIKWLNVYPPVAKDI